jgi:hypothetical protein
MITFFFFFFLIQAYKSSLFHCFLLAEGKKKKEREKEKESTLYITSFRSVAAVFVMSLCLMDATTAAICC